ncbi:MAG: cobalamin B12-binding domain-containing protein [Syntrophales bacterium]
METEKKTRVLIAKPGLDGHERGARVIAYGLGDQGYEVIYTGLRQKPEDIVKAAVQEDVKVLGLSILSGAHLALTKKVMDKLAAENAKDILVIVGGVIPEQDISKLKGMGVAEVFTSGASIKEVGAFISSQLS